MAYTRELAPVVVRPARLNDAPKLSQFFQEAWREAGPAALGFSGANDEAIGEISSEEFLRKRLATPTVLIVVAEEERKVIGFASIRRAEVRVAEISGMAVVERARGRGIGSRLLRKALESARKRGFASIVVKVEIANDRAVGFYKNAGFTETGKAVRRIGGVTAQLRVMSKRLR